MTRRRWIADAWDERTAALKGEQAAHLARVLRARAGMEFDIVVGDRVRRGAIAAVSDACVEFALGPEIEADVALPVALLLAIFKFDRMEWAIEKATELGVGRIVPVVARRTEKHLAQASAARVERWRRIAREAAQQSRRSNAPEIADPLPLQDAAREEPGALRLLLAERERTAMLRDAFGPVAEQAEERRILLGVGPEGGWTEEEEAMLVNQGWKAVSLGTRILRAETAAIAAVAIASALLD